MLDRLSDTLARLKQRIQSHREDIGPYEARTRCCLIDPLLGALGWDVSDPSIVQVESSIGDTAQRVDYALLNDSHRPVVFVEAKRLSDNAPAVAQAVGYVWEENQRRQTDVRYFVWTNGDAWMAWDIRQPSGAPLIRVAVTSANVAKTALGLVGLWRSSLVDGTYQPPMVLDTVGTRTVGTRTRSTPDNDVVGTDSTAHVQSPSVNWRLPNPPPLVNRRLSTESREAAIEDIKKLHLDLGLVTQRQVAEHYGVAPGTIAMYVRLIRDGKR